MVQGGRWFSMSGRAEVALGLGVVGLIDSSASWPLGLLLATAGLALGQRARRAGSGATAVLAVGLSGTAIFFSMLAGLAAVTAARTHLGAG